MDCSLPGSSVHEILQARILEWVAMSFSRGSSWPRDRTCVSYFGRWLLYHCTVWKAAAWKAPKIHCVPSNGFTEAVVFVGSGRGKKLRSCVFQSHVNKIINSLSKNNIPSQVLSFVSKLLSPSALLEYLDLTFPVTTISTIVTVAIPSDSRVAVGWRSWIVLCFTLHDVVLPYSCKTFCDWELLLSALPHLMPVGSLGG